MIHLLIWEAHFYQTLLSSKVLCWLSAVRASFLQHATTSCTSHDKTRSTTVLSLESSHTHSRDIGRLRGACSQALEQTGALGRGGSGGPAGVLVGDRGGRCGAVRCRRWLRAPITEGRWCCWRALRRLLAPGVARRDERELDSGLHEERPHALAFSETPLLTQEQ